MNKKLFFNFLKSSICFLSVFMVSTFSKVNAQTASTYSFAASSSTLTYISGGTTVSALIDDDGVATVPIGFTFNYCGTGYTGLRICSNGWMSFNTATTSIAWSNTLTNVNTLKPVLMPWFDDMTGYSTGAQVSYITSGSTGSKVFTIEYRDWDCDYSYENNLTFQVKLFEATGVIQYIYKQESGVFYGQSASIGIGDGATTPTYLSLNGTGTSPTASSTTFTTSIGSLPSSGQVYQFTPPVGCVGTPTAGATAATSDTICLGSTTTLSLPTATSGAGISYQWQSSPDGIVAYSNITSATSSTYVASPTASTYYRCVVTCSSGPTSVNSTPIQITFRNSVASTTPNFRCGTGTVSLAATGSSGTTLRWYAAATGGSSLGSGSPFTTPTIAATTNYYVGAETISVGVGRIGSGTSTSSGTGSSPFSQSWESNRSQYLVLATDLTASGLVAGNISAMSIPITSKLSALAFGNYSIKMAHTSATSLTASTYLTPTFTNVYGPASYSSVAGANNFSFGTMFNWDGTSNIVVDICFDNDPTGTGGPLYSSNDVVAATTKSYTAVVGRYADNSVFCGTTTGGTFVSTTLLPNFSFTGNVVCSSPRALVTATVNTPPTLSVTSNQAICNNTVATISVTSTLSNYNTYTWAPITNLFTDAACTVAYTAGASATTVYYKSTTAGANTFTCSANNSTTLCATTTTSTITNLPSSVVVTATPSNLCFSGNVALSITSGAYGAAQFQWQTSSDNSTWGDSTGMVSSSLNTNTLSNTRYYRVILKNSSGVFCLNATSDTALVYKPSVVTVTDGQRCATGSVTLGATGNDGTLNWYAASTGGSSLGTGTSFITPGISSTTTYYVESEAKPDINGTIGTGTSTTSSSGYPTAFGNYWYQEWQQIVYTAAELTAAGNVPGNISKISFNILGVPGPTTISGYALRMASTSLSTLSTFTTTGLTTVYGPSSISPSSGVNTITLSTPYYWDGTSNIIVDIRADGAYGSANATTYYTATTGNTCLYAYSFSSVGSAFYTSGPTTYTSTSRPNIQFFQQGCKSSRSPVVATINPLPVPTISPATTGPIQICAGLTTTLTGGGGGNYQWRDASGPISGETSSTFTTGATGSYRVVVTNPTTGCKDSSVVVAVNVNPTPTVSISPVGTTAICADSSQKLTSVVSGPGLTYKWYNSGVLIAGATTDSLRVNTSGVYTMRVFLGTCSDTSNDATIVVNPLPASSFTKTGTTGAICLGQTLELTALSIPSTSSYQWFRDGVAISGATSQIYNAAIGGIYTVRIKDLNNCRKQSDTLTVINTPMGVPDLSPANLRFCEGTVVKLYANAGPFADSFAWTRNGVLLPDTTSSITTGLLGVYDVTVTDVYGCTLTSPKSTVTVDPLPIKPVITKSGSVLRTVDPYTTYQWYRNGKMITGANARSYTMMFDGNYHVVVTNGFGCINTSDVLSIQGLSVKQIARQDVNVEVYPNPSQSIINISAPIEVNLVVRDIQGKQIVDLKNAKQVDMSAYADGIYIFTITDKDGVVVKMDKVVKRTNQ